MAGFSRATEWRVFLRSLLVQGSWNYETLIGTGFAFTVLPVLRCLYPADEEALREATLRHAEIFNSHPYFATVAVGAVARMEQERVDPRVVARFKSALRGSLGSLGDQLIWSAWRPATVLLGLVLLLAGVAWWASILLFLMLYNTLNVGLRFWGWRIGVTHGLEVGRALREAPLQTVVRRATEIGSLAAGVALSIAAAPALSDRLAAAADIVAIALGIGMGMRAPQAFAVVVIATWILGIALGLTR